MRTGLALACALVAACNGSPGSGDDTAGPDAEVPTPGVPGPPGCGFDSAAFCDPFDGPSTSNGRARELDAALWSGGRASPGLPSADGNAVAIGKATLPPCRVGLPARVLPEQDTLICDSINAVKSNHLLVAAAAQNYGQSSYRIRRPFDFAGRTGTITFDATALPTALQGWISVAITKEPTSVPSYLKVQNEENGALPRNALEVHFLQNCQVADMVSVLYIISYDDFQQTIHTVEGAERHCISAKAGQLNRFQIKLSKDHVAIYGSPVSDDGVTFAPVELLAETDVALPFTRGYVHLTTHNHATLKYSNDTVDAWVTRWDNVGFDGPMLGGWREYEVPDSLTMAATGDKQNIGYRLDDLTARGWSAPLSFAGVDPSGATKAQIALVTWMHLEWGTPSQFVLNYRINGGPPHAAHIPASQLALISAMPVSGTLPLVLDVDVSELHAGPNTIQLATTDVPTSYPPVVYNLDLVLETP